MPTIIPWSSIEIGDLDVFAPSPPCLVVHTSYIDGEPESSVTYFWQDEATGLLNHEVLFLRAVGFDEALAWAQEHAPTKSIERIHVRHRSARGESPKESQKEGAKGPQTAEAGKSKAEGEGSLKQRSSSAAYACHSS
jgi:hypothetical protein